MNKRYAGLPVKVFRWVIDDPTELNPKPREEWAPATCVDAKEDEWIAVAYADGTREVLHWRGQWSWA